MLDLTVPSPQESRGVKWKAITEWRFFRPAMGAALAVLCGLILWGTPIGDGWENGSFDYQVRFGSRAITNQVVLVQMDNDSYRELHQQRYDPQQSKSWQPWDRRIHAELLDRLADSGAKLVVMDTFFSVPRDPAADAALVAALRRQRGVVLTEHQEW